MAREGFDESFERLREQSNRLAKTQRTADNLDEIVEERVELDRLRDEVTGARKDVVSRYEAPAPDVVAASRGSRSTQRIGKIGAVIAGVLLVVVVLVAAVSLRTLRDGFPLRLVETVESMEERTDPSGCYWQVHATLRNESEQTITVTRIMTVLNRSRSGARDLVAPTIEPGKTRVVTGTWRLPATEGCPEPADVAHADMVITFTHPAVNASSPGAPPTKRSVTRGF